MFVIGKIVDGRLSGGKLCDLLSGLLAKVGKIIDVVILNWGFYKVEFKSSKVTAKVVFLSPLALGSARVHFRKWFQGFDPASDAASSFIPQGERGFPVTACSPSHCREYLPLLPQIGRTLGTYLESPLSAASVVAKAAGLPSVRVIISDPTRLPTEISLPTLAGD